VCWSYNLTVGLVGMDKIAAHEQIRALKIVPAASKEGCAKPGERRQRGRLEGEIVSFCCRR
jgi:hypothetical protein